MKKSQLRKIIKQSIKEIEVAGGQKRATKSCRQKCEERWAACCPNNIFGCVIGCKIKGWWNSGYAPGNSYAVSEEDQMKVGDNTGNTPITPGKDHVIPLPFPPHTPLPHKHPHPKGMHEIKKMKKLDLRNIVKESIKELMNEQTWQGLPSGPNWQTLQQNWSNGNVPPPPQAFLNRMATMGCPGKQQRLSVLVPRFDSLQQTGINPTTGAQGPNHPGPGMQNWGSNPVWQSQLASKIMWLYTDMTQNC